VKVRRADSAQASARHGRDALNRAIPAIEGT
jgi:hypothetical protein